jgi:hypothetical protein
VTRPPTASPAQRVCPHCARIAHTDARRCPFCGRGYKRRLLLTMAVMLTVFAVGLLGGMALMLAAIGERVEDELDTRIGTVQTEVQRSVEQVGDDLAEQLDQRLQQNGLSAP